MKAAKSYATVLYRAEATRDEVRNAIDSIREATGVRLRANRALVPDQDGRIRAALLVYSPEGQRAAVQLVTALGFSAADVWLVAEPVPVDPETRPDLWFVCRDDNRIGPLPTSKDGVNLPPRDDMERRWMTRAGRMCSAHPKQCPLFFCTRAKGHSGDHYAQGGEGSAARWPDSQSTRSEEG